MLLIYDRTLFWCPLLYFYIHPYYPLYLSYAEEYLYRRIWAPRNLPSTTRCPKPTIASQKLPGFLKSKPTSTSYLLLSDSIYDMPSHMSKRATSMGFGKKYEICKNYHYPSPDQYNKSSLFNLSPRKGVSFGLGREDIKAVSLLPKDKTPGPGQYENAMK